MGQWLQENWTLVSSHPALFFGFALTIAASTFGSAKWYFGDRIERLKDERDQAQKKLGERQGLPAHLPTADALGQTTADKSVSRAPELAKRAGLVEAFENRGEASPAIEQAIAKADWVWVLSNKGTDWVGESGILTRPLQRRWAQGEHVRLRLLLLNPRSPWLKSRRANHKGWTGDCHAAASSFRAAHEEVQQFALQRDVDPVKFHKFDPSWRFVMTNREIFLQTYKTIAQVSDERILQFTSESTIYRSAFRFFEYVYDLDSAEEGELSVIEALRQKPILQRVSSGCLLTRTRQGKLEALLLFKDGMVALPKGGIDEAETSPEAALRELNEETNADKSQIPADDLTFLHWVAASQVDFDTVMTKGIVFYHCHVPDSVDLGVLNGSAQWCDERALDGKPWRYSYVPEVLAKVGIRPAWGNNPFL